MTVIIGIADGRAVYMGADSFIGNGDYALQYKHPKIVRRELPGGAAYSVWRFRGNAPHAAAWGYDLARTQAGGRRALLRGN